LYLYMRLISILVPDEYVNEYEADVVQLVMCYAVILASWGSNNVCIVPFMWEIIFLLFIPSVITAKAK